MRKPKVDHVEIVQIAIPVLLEAVLVSVFIAGCAAWVIIAATPIPDVMQ